MRVALEDGARAHLVHQGDHPLQVRSLRFQRDLFEKAVGTLASSGHFLSKALGLTHDASAVIEELAVAGLESLLARCYTAAARAGDLPDLIANGTRAIAQPRAGAAGNRRCASWRG